MISFHSQKIYINLKITQVLIVLGCFFLWSILPYNLNHASFFNGIPLMQFNYTPSPLPIHTHTHRRTHTRRIQELFLLEHDFTYHCGMGNTHCTEKAWVDCGRMLKYHMIKPCNSHVPWLYFIPDRRSFLFLG